MFSCSPSRRIERILRKNPELLKVDSVPIYDTLYIGNVTFDTIIRLDTSTTSMDSILQAIAIDTIIKENILLIYRNKRLLNDTIKLNIPIIFILNGKEYTSIAYVKFWQSGDKLPYKQSMTPSIITDQRSVGCPELSLQRSWFDKLKDYFFWLVIIAAALAVVYRKILKD